MLKQQIKVFDLCAKGVEVQGCTLPLSYPTEEDALASGGAYFGTCGRGLKLPESVTFSTQIEVTPLILSYSSVKLTLSRVYAPSVVEINGRKVGATASDKRVYSFDVKNYLHLGNNKLTITQSGEGFVPNEYRITPFSVGTCEIIAYNHALINTVFVRQEALLGRVRVFISLPDFDTESGLRAVATLLSPGGRVYFCGMLGGEGSIDITEPNLWWPRGLGVQNLYRLTVNLYYDNEIIDSADIKIGLTEYALCDNGSELPTLTSSGVPVLTRGVCYLPDSAILPALNGERTRSLVSSAAAMGVNTFLVPDADVYQTDLFFSLCDAAGITVWQEIRCDGDLNEKALEVADNLVPLLYHPSFAAVIYTGGAPGVGLQALLGGKCCVNLDSLESVVTEPYATLPTLSTLKKFVPEDEMNVFSDTLEWVSTLEDNKELFDSSYYKCPRSVSEIGYVSGLRALSKVRDEVNRVRRSTSQKKHIILSSLSDPRPRISPSLIDSYGSFKGAAFGISNLYSDAYVGAVNDGTRVTFFISNAKKEDHNGRLEYSVIDASGKCIFRDGFEALAPALSSVDILTVDFDEIVGKRLDECFVFYRLTDGFLTASQGTLFFTPSKRFKYMHPGIKTELSGNFSDFVLTVSAEAYAGKVYVELPETDAVFSDNFFDIADGSSKTVEIKTAHAVAIEVLRREIRVYTLYDLGRD